MRSWLDEVGPCAHLCSFVLIERRRHSSLSGPLIVWLGVRWVLNMHAFTSFCSCLWMCYGYLFWVSASTTSPQGWTINLNCGPNEPFLPWVTVRGFYHSNRNDTRLAPCAPPRAPPCHSCIPELYLAFKPFAHTCPSKASPPSYWLDVLCITQSGFPWLPHVVPALVPLLWPSLSSPMLTVAPAGKGLVGSTPSCVQESGMVPGLKEEFLSSLSFLFIFKFF